MTIDRNQLSILLSRISGAKFGGLTTFTETKLRKTNGERSKELKRLNPFFGKVFSLRNISVLFCFDYNGNVARQRVREGKEADEWQRGESWHEAVLDENGKLTAFCRHKDNGSIYLRVRVLHKGKTTYIATDRIESEGVVYNAGDEVPFEAIEPYYSERRPYANQGVEEGKEIAATTLKFESVRAIRANGQSYNINHGNEQAEVAEVAQVIADFVASLPDVSAADLPQSEQAATN